MGSELTLKATGVATLLVSGAQLLADSMRHTETTPAHLAMQLLELRETHAALVRVGIDAGEVTSQTRRILAGLPTSAGRSSNVDVRLLSLIRGAEERAGHLLVQPDDLLTYLAKDVLEPLGVALRNTPAGIEALVTYLDSIEREVDHFDSSFKLPGFTVGAQFFFKQAQKLADESKNAEVLPLHVLAAITNFRLKNADRLGCTDAGPPAEVCRQAVANLPRTHEGKAFVGLTLAALIRCIRRYARPGRDLPQSAVMSALICETRWPFSEARRWFGADDDETKSKFEAAGYQGVFIRIDEDVDFATVSVSVVDPMARVEVYNFKHQKPNEAMPPPLVDVTDARTLVLRPADDRTSTVAMGMVLGLLKGTARDDGAGCIEALRDAGYDVTPGQGTVQVGGLARSIVHATRGDTHVELRVFEYDNASFETATFVRRLGVFVAMPEEAEVAPVPKVALQKLLDVLRD